MTINEQTAFDTFTDLTHTSPPSDASSGIGGGSLATYGEERETLLSTLIKSEYANNSSYAFPPGIVDTQGFQNGGISNGELNHPDSPDSGMSAGTTGSGDMDSWGSSGSIINNLLVGTFTNASSYEIPAAVVEGASYDTFTQLNHGSTETGAEVGYTYLGTRVSGNVYVDSEAGTKTADAATVSGVTIRSEKAGLSFTTAADPTDGQYKLDVGDGGTYTVVADHPLFGTDSVTVDLNPGESMPDVDLVLGAGGSVGFLRRRIG